MRNKYIYISIVLLFLLPSRMSAGVDPTRAAAFATIAAAASKVNIAQDAVITSQLGAHIVLNNEVKKVTNFKRKFNEYLSTYMIFLLWQRSFMESIMRLILPLPMFEI